MKITLELHGRPSQTSEAKFLRREGNTAIILGYLKDETHYSLTDGRRLGGNWDFWRICAKDCQRIKAMKEKVMCNHCNDTGDCPNCGGSGNDPKEHGESCPDCQGSGACKYCWESRKAEMA